MPQASKENWHDKKEMTKGKSRQISIYQPEWSRALPGLQAARARRSKTRTPACKKKKKVLGFTWWEEARQRPKRQRDQKGEQEKPRGGLRDEDGFNYPIKGHWKCHFLSVKREISPLRVAVKELCAFTLPASQEGRFVLCRSLGCGDHENTLYQNRFVGHIWFLLWQLWN